MKTSGESALSPYRVLDLTEGECLLAGRMMGDLGADVIQIEKPGGSPSRNRAPFYKDIPHPEKSLFWFSFCHNKRGITLDIETADGQDLFKRLIRTAHFVFESSEPGYLDSLGLGYQTLKVINPGIILVSITLFGQNGPKAHYKGSELISWASSNMLYASGDPDRPPSVTATPLAGQQAAVAAVMGALTAHWHCRSSGQGQHVDVSMQEVMEWNTMCYSQFWPCHHMEMTRVGWGRPLNPKVYSRSGFPCKDGYAAVTVSAGAVWIYKATTELHQWMDEEGMLPDWLKGYDWSTFDLSKFKEQEELNRYQEPAKNFFATKTKAELWRAAVERKTLTAPVRDFKDNFEDPHIRARGFWIDIEHQELGEAISYPGACFRMSKSPLSFRRRAPLIGEHNDEVYLNELGLSDKELLILKSNRVI
jgi:crotonobetainyl-CoA:carnitine CoA-transferase CaiB-like acyl-CoA transferase